MVQFKISLIFLLLNSTFALEATPQCNKYEAYANPEDAKSLGLISDERNNGGQLGPTRDQDSVGFCYAYAASDMTEAWLKKNGHMPANQNVSAMAMALQYEEGGNQFAKGLDDYRSQMTRREQISGNLAGFNEEVARMREELARTQEERYRLLKAQSNGQATNQNKEPAESRGGQESGTNSATSNKSALSGKLSVKKSDKAMKQIAEDILKNAEDMNSNAAGRSSRGGTTSERGPQQGSGESIEEMDERIRRMQNTINGYMDLIEQLQDRINEIDRTSLDALVPSGGFTAQALNNSWPKICWESEVSSRDNRIKEIYENNRELFSSMAFTPDNLATVLGNIALVEDAQSQPQSSCGYYQIMKSMFPGLPFRDSQTMMDFFTRLDLRSNMFRDILDESCGEKNLSTQPVAHSTKVNHEHPIQNNDHIFAKIDETLEKGDIAGISYRSSLFNKNDFASEERKDYHASVIVGKMKVCGEEHYIVRNSWGQDSCKTHQQYFQSTEFSMDEMVESMRAESVCRVERDDFQNAEYPKCAGGEAGMTCREEILRESEMFYRACMTRIAVPKYEKQNHQFFCDKQGNFIVSKGYLKSATYSMDYISN